MWLLWGAAVRRRKEKGGVGYLAVLDNYDLQSMVDEKGIVQQPLWIVYW
jgi:hypothetical protein